MSSVKKNFSYNLIYQFLSIGSVLIVTPYITRTLGAHQTGVYSFTLSHAHYFLLFAMLGLSNYGSRAIAKAREAQRQGGDPDSVSRTFCSIYGMQFLTGLLAVLGYLAYLIWFAREDREIAAVQLLYVLSAVFDINWFFFGMEEFRLTVVRNSIVKVASIAAVFLFVKKPSDLLIYTLIMSGSICVSAMVLWAYLGRFVHFVRPKGKEILQHVKPNLVLFIPVIAISVYHVMDKLMIGYILPERAEVSFYDNAYKIMEIPHAFINALGVVMLPKMSALAQKKDTKESRLYIERSMEFSLLLAIPVSFGLAAVARTLAPVYLGEEFIACGVLMEALAPIGVIKSWANVIRTQYLLPNQHDTVYVVSVVGGAAMNVVANLLLIPQLGTLGAVVGTLIAETVVMLCQTVYAARQLPVMTYLKRALPSLLAGLVMFVIVAQIGRRRQGGIGLLALQIGTGAALYGGYLVCYLLRARKAAKG